MQIKQYWIYLRNEFPEVEIRHVSGDPTTVEGEQVQSFLNGQPIYSGDWIKYNDDGSTEIIKEKDYGQHNVREQQSS